MSLIPRSEFDLLLHDIKRAVGCATMGGRVTGHEILLTGLQRAEYARLEGTEWAPELIVRYQQAIREYLQFYDLLGDGRR
jgi:hypothetical protein